MRVLSADMLGFETAVEPSHCCGMLEDEVTMRLRVPFLLLIALPASDSCDCAQAGLAEGADCVNAQECDGGLVCDPATSTCQSVSDCTANADCGAGAICTGGNCVDNRAGGSCDADVNCVEGERCEDGTCVPIPGEGEGEGEGGPGEDCATADDCAPPLVCDPASSTCAAGVECESAADCGGAAFCDADGVCQPAGPGTACTSDAECAEAERCVGVVCIPDECEAEAFSAEPIPANVMLTIDRSGSMLEEIDGVAKWDIARDAVDALVTARGDVVRFGLNAFPGFNQSCSDGADCGPGQLAIDIPLDDTNTAAAISGFLDSADTCSFGTPIAEDMQLLLAYDGLHDATRANYVVLLTDGQATCDDPVPVVEELAALIPPVQTFVVGFGSGVDLQQLEDMATAGASGFPPFVAEDAASLTAALDVIGGAVLSCDYTLADAGDDPDLLSVFFNGQPVPRDPTQASGWDYDPPTDLLRFSGNACIALQNGIVTDLTIAFGCPVIGEGEGEGEGEEGEGEGEGGEGEGEGGGQCDDRCVNPCGNEACLIPPGECGPCGSDADCCPGSLCLSNGSCLLIGG